MLAAILALVSQINAFTASAIATSLAVIIEIVLRVVPSDKPLSIAYMIEDVVHGIASFFGAVGGALDKIIPQRKAK